MVRRSRRSRYLAIDARKQHDAGRGRCPELEGGCRRGGIGEVEHGKRSVGLIRDPQPAAAQGQRAGPGSPAGDLGQRTQGAVLDREGRDRVRPAGRDRDSTSVRDDARGLPRTLGGILSWSSRCASTQPSPSRRATHTSELSSHATTSRSSTTTAWRGPAPGGRWIGSAAPREASRPVDPEPVDSIGAEVADEDLLAHDQRLVRVRTVLPVRVRTRPGEAQHVERPGQRAVVADREAAHRPRPVVRDQQQTGIRRERQVAGDSRHRSRSLDSSASSPDSSIR